MVEPSDHAQPFRYETLAEILDLSMGLCLLVTGACEIVYATSALKEWLQRDASALTERAGRLTAKDNERALELRTWVAGVVAAADSTVHYLSVERDDHPPLILRAHALDAADLPEPDRSQHLAVISVHDALAVRSLGELSPLFELTSAESALVEQILSGASMTDAEAALHITPNTARTHLKSIYRKTGAHSQADLVRLLKDAASISPRNVEATMRRSSPHEDDVGGAPRHCLRGSA
ncbi:MAG TPA: helix-turn-helix transcriptional regulator [Chloroflexota bacterium]